MHRIHRRLAERLASGEAGYFELADECESAGEFEVLAALDGLAERGYAGVEDRRVWGVTDEGRRWAGELDDVEAAVVGGMCRAVDVEAELHSRGGPNVSGVLVRLLMLEALGRVEMGETLGEWETARERPVSTRLSFAAWSDAEELAWETGWAGSTRPVADV